MVGVDRKKNRYGDIYNYLIYYDESGKKRFYISEDEVTKEVLKVLKSIKIPDEDFEEAKQRILATFDGEKNFYKNTVKELQKESAEIDKKLNKLLDLFIEGKITEEAYAPKYEQLKKERSEILEQIAEHQNGDSEFRESLTFFLACKNKFYDYFMESSNIELKRQLLKFITRTFYINGGKVEITLRSPFTFMQKTALSDGFEKWRE